MKNKTENLKNIITKEFGIGVSSIAYNIGKKSDMFENENLPGYIDVFTITVNKTAEEMKELQKTQSFGESAGKVMDYFVNQKTNAVLYFKGYNQPKNVAVGEVIPNARKELNTSSSNVSG